MLAGYRHQSIMDTNVEIVAKVSKHLAHRCVQVSTEIMQNVAKSWVKISPMLDVKVQKKKKQNI